MFFSSSRGHTFFNREKFVIVDGVVAVGKIGLVFYTLRQC